jgi:hypothetical protein
MHVDHLRRGKDVRRVGVISLWGKGVSLSRARFLSSDLTVVQGASAVSV